MIRRLSLLNQWENDLIFLMQLPFGHVDSGSGVPKCFPILPVSEPSIIIVFVSDCTVIDLLITAITDIRRLIEP